MRTIRVHEYQRVFFALDGRQDSIPDAYKSALTQANEQYALQHREPLFNWVNPHAIQFRHVVGVVRIGDLTLEILPKVHKGEDDGTLDRAYLLRLLQVSGTLPLSTNEIASLATQSGALIDIVLRLFADEATTQLKQGRIHQYQHVQSVRTTVRGRLLVKQHILRSASGDVNLPCRYTDFIADHALNRLLHTAAHVGWRVASDTHTIQQLRCVYNQFDDVQLLQAPFAPSIPKLLLDRSDRRFGQAAKLAERVLRSISPHVRGGKTEFISLLFNMNELFEASMTRLLKRVVPSGISFTAQGPQRHLLKREGGSAFAMKPDIVIGLETPQHPTTVIDTKWKLLDPSDVNRSGVAQADAYQMYAYANRYNAHRVVLLYPHWYAGGAAPGLQTTYHLPDDSGRTIEVWTVDVREEVEGIGILGEIMAPTLAVQI